MVHKKSSASTRSHADERPPASSLVMMAWFPVPGLAAMNLLMLASGMHDPIATSVAGDLRNVVWAHLACQLMVGVGVTMAVVRRLNLEGPHHEQETTAAIRRDHLTGWALQLLAGLSFAAYMLAA